jgi:hypothetical protein
VTRREKLETSGSGAVSRQSEYYRHTGGVLCVAIDSVYATVLKSTAEISPVMFFSCASLVPPPISRSCGEGGGGGGGGSCGGSMGVSERGDNT